MLSCCALHEEIMQLISADKHKRWHRSVCVCVRKLTACAPNRVALLAVAAAVASVVLLHPACNMQCPKAAMAFSGLCLR